MLFIEPPHDAHALDTSGSPASLVGKIGSVFTSSATQHGCQESTILGFIPTFLHQGMVVAGLPYASQGQMSTEEVKGGSPYGASTITNGDGSRQTSEIRALRSPSLPHLNAEMIKGRQPWLAAPLPLSACALRLEQNSYG
ncbi:multimeric flavodoxin WrbA [Rhizobium binae]|uniref:Multimeric flavodoxin WrbA n=1 Tax=Rhizobium binae TaxID=1138190 RepID=A0ABV2MEZ8_9HYPH